ncbi:hypothetical protein GCM10009092_30310 [Bowmanella denitrificans]|uniref:Lipoprotein n=1 Tax=Bowmanella denitrificans TaxID=366582 RepID=A0ABP3H7A2_9ALTE
MVAVNSKNYGIAPGRWLGMAGLFVCLLLSGCQSTGRSSVAVGPGVGPQANQPLGDKKRAYRYDSNIFLDVAVPVFDPGIPQDDAKLEEEGIWPQLRRSEANRFAVQTKRALENTGAFGAVTVVPNPQMTADLYVIGRIQESNSEDVKIKIELVDISGQKWDEEVFKHRVSKGFYRDKLNEGKDSYEPVFREIADYVYLQLLKRSEQRKQELKKIAAIRFAQSYAPEAFAGYLDTNRRGVVELKRLPDESDPMLARMAPLRVQDQLFFDRLQSQYEGFNAKTDESYHSWQKETLPEVAAAREARNAAVVQGILGAVLVGAAIANSDADSTSSQILTAGVGIGGALLIKNSLDKSAEARVHKAAIDEMGASLDIEMSPQVIKLNDENVELQGTAQEQYQQWQAHLHKIYQMEQTPDRQL